MSCNPGVPAGNAVASGVEVEGQEMEKIWQGIVAIVMIIVTVILSPWLKPPSDPDDWP